ncbi:MAG: hypothetical protein ABJC19_09200 [Gemmatimonadota bacterium]
MTRAPLDVHDVQLERTEDRVVLSGAVADQRLFWAMPPRSSIMLRGEPFVAALLLSAMRTGRALVIPESAPVEAAFLEGMASLQSIFLRWFPGLTPITIEARSIGPRTGAFGTMAGYSGGVDSSYTVQRLATRLDGTVLFDGIEYRDANPTLMSQVNRTLSGSMAAAGVPLSIVQTNVKAVGRATGGKWSEFIGGALASIPHAMGLADYTIAGSNSWENLRPYGTHPFTDPLWGSDALHIHHHGADALRIEKLAHLRAAPELLAVLRVCFQGEDYNCGVCHKCLQTSAALRALGIACEAMPPLRDARLLRRLEVEHDGDLADWIEILTPELATGDPELARELTRLMARYRTRKLLRAVDAAVLGGLSRRLLRGIGLLRRGGKHPLPPSSGADPASEA